MRHIRPGRITGEDRMRNALLQTVDSCDKMIPISAEIAFRPNMVVTIIGHCLTYV